MRRRILVLCAGAYVAGLEVIELALMQGLVERGHTVHCVVNGWTNGDFAQRLTKAGIPHSVAYTGALSISPRWSSLRQVADTLRHIRPAQKSVRRVLASFVPDVIVACNRDPLLLLWPCLRAYPVLFHTHDVPDVSGKAKVIVRTVARRATAFAAVSVFVRDRMVELGVSSDKIAVVYNGLKETTTREREYRTGPTPVVGIAGQVGPWKGHDDLVDALGILHARGVAFSCHIVGHGDAAYRASLERRAEQNGVIENIVWRGFVADPDAIYEPLDVLVVPSRTGDPFPTTTLEGSIRGLPIVGTRQGGIPEQIVDGETGYVVESEDPTALADALEPLVRSAELRERIGRAAHSHVAVRFTYDRMVEAFEQVCETTIDLYHADHPA